MAFLTKKEFAERCGKTTKDIAVSVGRKKVIYTSDGMVDDSIEPNKTFLLKYSRKVESKSEIKGATTLDPELPLPGFNLETLKLTAQIKKMEQEIEKLTITNSKSKGELIPVNLIDSIFLQHNQSILSEAQNTLRDILTIFKKRRDLSPSESSEISSEFTDRLNEMMKRAADATVKSIDLVVGEFSLKRGVGERD